MKEEGKWTPHIIAAAALVVFIVLGLACASAPKPPTEIVYNPSIPKDQTAALLIPPGFYEVFEFNVAPLNPRWYQASMRSPGMNVIIPAGENSITFHYYGGDGADVKNKRLYFKTVAGRSYGLTSDGYQIGRSMRLFFNIYEISENRAPEADEQLLFIKQADGLKSLIVLDKGTDEERTFMTGSLMPELRVIVPKGEHTIDVELTPGYIDQFSSHLEPVGEQPRHFTASSNPVRYSVSLKSSGLGQNTKTTYTLTMK